MPHASIDWSWLPAISTVSVAGHAIEPLRERAFEERVLGGEVAL